MTPDILALAAAVREAFEALDAAQVACNRAWEEARAAQQARDSANAAYYHAKEALIEAVSGDAVRKVEYAS